MIGGIVALILGFIGAFLPVMPTVPFVILAAFCFARSNPKFEAWLLDHPHFGPHIHAWRRNGAIPRRGKLISSVMLAGSGVLGLIFVPMPWGAIPAAIAVISGTWIWSRPDA
nr:YbaN family protein [Sphingomonas japonica]